ncbi:pilus assembly protein CpaB, partial [Escherichia coli]|nr:pilus assembly protein CpaB [Escherichia coli]
MRTRIIAAICAIVLAVAGTLALISYVRGADARALAGTRTVDVLVA